MKLFGKTWHRVLAVVLAVLVVTGGIPFVAGTHVNDLLTPWREVPEEPTGVSLLDAAVQMAAEELDEEVAPHLQEPQVPATFYRDWFDPEDRIGGWGDWIELGIAGDAWDISKDAGGRDISGTGIAPQSRDHVEQGYRFGGPSGYPTPPAAADGAFSLVSPLISLRSLPVSMENWDDDIFPESIQVALAGEDDEGAVDLTAFADGSGVSIQSFPVDCPIGNVCSIWPDAGGSRTLSELDAAWESVKDNPIDTQRPQFGGDVDFMDRIILYMDHRFNLADASDDGFDRANISVLPERSMELTSLSTYRGEQSGFAEERLDLTAWAGQDVRLVFSVDATGNSVTQKRLDLFEDCGDLCGWDISNLRIEGPTHQHNVRLDRVLYPVPSGDPDGSQYVARPGDDPFGVLLLNRGQMTEDVEITMRMVDEDENEIPCTLQVDGLRPGDAKVIEFPADPGGCGPTVVAGRTYNVTFTASLMDEDREDRYEADNRLQIEVFGDGPDIRLDELRSVTGQVAEPDDPVGILANLRNYAITDGQANISLDINHRNATGGFHKGVQGDESLVRFESENNQTVGVPWGQERSVRWDLRLQEVGCYWIRANITDPAGTPLDGNGTTLGVGVSMNPSEEDECVSQYDLALADARIDTDYDWEDVGLGPGTDATANVTIENRGALDIQKARVSLGIQRDGGSFTKYYNVTLDSGFTLGTNADDNQTHVKIPFTLPPDDGSYHIVFGADLLGELVPGVPLEDNNLTNDCGLLGLRPNDGVLVQSIEFLNRTAQHDPCPFEKTPINIESNPVVDVDFRVLPEAGRTGAAFPRDFRLDVINKGNVVVEGTCIVLLVQHSLSDWLLNRAWVVAQSPLPGHTQPWDELNLRNPVDPSLSRSALSQITLPEYGMYFVSVFLFQDLEDESTCPPDEDTREDVLHRMRLDAFDTIYSDTFEPGGAFSDAIFEGLVDGEQMVPRSDSWNRLRGLAPDGDGGFNQQRLWQFGDPETGQYPDDADAVLEFPPVDLSSAARALLAISHNYDLEANYDGARVEASMDQGETWQPLFPRAQEGYGGTVHADSPLNPERDPTVATPAWTGTSRDRSDDGWVIDEFDLAQLPGFTTPVQLVRLSQEGLGGPHLEPGGLQREGGIAWHPTQWGLDADCPDLPLAECWYRENVNWHNPLPLCDPQAHPSGRLPSGLEGSHVQDVCASRPADLDDASHHYWWTGSVGHEKVAHPGTSLVFDVTIGEGDIHEGDTARIAFWYWKDEGGLLFAGELPEQQISGSSVTGYRAWGEESRFATEAATGGWKRGEFVIHDAYDRLQTEGSPLTATVRIQFVDGTGQGPSFNGVGPESSSRGAVIDGVVFEVVDPNGAVVARDLVPDGDIDTSFMEASKSYFPAHRGPPQFLPKLTGGLSVYGEAWAWQECKKNGPYNPPGFGPGIVHAYCHVFGSWKSVEEAAFCELYGALCSGGKAKDFGWSRVAKAGVTNEGECSDDDQELACEAWGIREEHTRRGEIAPVWQFGVAREVGEDDIRYTYPSNAHQRLVTPRVDLSVVVGESATLTFWELYDLMHEDNNREGEWGDGCTTTGPLSCHAERSGMGERNILVQTVEPTPGGGERVGEWEPLEYDFVTERRAQPNNRDDCTNDIPAWCPARLDISDYIGQEVRFAFDIQTKRVPWAFDQFENSDEKPLGWTWLVDEVGIEAASMTGQPVQLRLRAGTDASISEGHWKLQNVQLVGIPYGTNVAIVPDEPLRDTYKRGPGEVLVFNGTVRNLGPALETDLFLDLNVIPMGAEADDAPNPTVKFLRDPFGKRSDPNVTSTLGPINIDSAGSTNLAGDPTDRVFYAIEVELPEKGEEGHEYQFTLRLVDSIGVLFVDQNIGDHERVFDVQIDPSPGNLEPQRFHVHPPTVDVEETAKFRLELGNLGPVSMVDDDVHVSATRLGGEGGPVTIADGLRLDLPPESTGTLTWEWSPQAPGFYRITATADRQPFYTHVMVGEEPLYFLEDFSVDPFTQGGWSRNPGECPPSATDCWRHVTSFSDGAIILENGGSSQAWARTPVLETLAVLGQDPDEGEQDIVQGHSPFSPHLSLTYRSILLGEDTIKVMAHRHDDLGGHRNLMTVDTHSGRTGAQGLDGSDGVNWHQASFPLFDPDDNVLQNSDRLLAGHNVSFQFQADLGSSLSQHFIIDRVSVSSYNVEVAPDRHHVVLRPGADKTFYFRVENTGAATDTYEVGLRNFEDDGSIQSLIAGSGIVMEIAESSRALTLEPGESGLAAVNVSIPFERIPPIGGVTLEVEVVSSKDRNLAATGVIHVDDFILDDLPDLVMDLRRPGGETGPVGEGEQATFVVSVTNDGSLASRATDVVVFACPDEYVDEDGRKQSVDSIKECGEFGLARELAELRMPVLEPSQDMEAGQTDDVWTTTVSWVPEVLTGRGDYTIVAVADPLRNVPQYDRASSIDTLDLVVTPFEQPNLNVRSLSITDANGEPVTTAFAGDLLNIEGTVENIGDDTAPNVRVRILNQFALRDERIGNLNPGASHTLNAQWVAEPGNWVVRFEASTGVVEASTDNNAKSWSLSIRSGTLEAKWQPETLHLDPGEHSQALLRVQNHRDETLGLKVRTTLDDVAAMGLPEGFEIPRGASNEFPVALTVSPFAERGTHLVNVDLVQQETGNTLASSTLEVHVGAERKLQLVPEPLLTPPGTARLPLEFRNDGNAPESFTVELEAPDGWGATAVPPAVRLDPGFMRSVQGVLEIPAGTPAGRYAVMVVAGDGLRESVPVDVVRQPVWRTEVTAVHSHRDPMEVMVRVENVGNQRGVPEFRLDAESEATYSVRPTPTPHEPGESRSYGVSVASAEASSLVLPGKDTPVPLQAPPRTLNVEAVRLDVQSAGVVTAGDTVDFRFGVRNVDDKPRPELLVRLWIDGKLSESHRVSLENGEERNLDFRFEPGRGGPRVVTATVSSGDEFVARTLILDVESAESRFAIPGPAPGLLILVLFLAAVVAWRRWDP